MVQGRYDAHRKHAGGQRLCLSGEGWAGKWTFGYKLEPG